VEREQKKASVCGVLFERNNEFQLFAMDHEKAKRCEHPAVGDGVGCLNEYAMSRDSNRSAYR